MIYFLEQGLIIYVIVISADAYSVFRPQYAPIDIVSQPNDFELSERIKLLPPLQLLWILANMENLRSLEEEKNRIDGVINDEKKKRTIIKRLICPPLTCSFDWRPA